MSRAKRALIGAGFLAHPTKRTASFRQRLTRDHLMKQRDVTAERWVNLKLRRFPTGEFSSVQGLD